MKRKVQKAMENQLLPFMLCIAELISWDSLKDDTVANFGFAPIWPPSIRGTCVHGLVSMRLYPGSQLFEWISVLTGEQPEVGSEIDFQNLVGSLVQIRVEQMYSLAGEKYNLVTEIFDY